MLLPVQTSSLANHNPCVHEDRLLPRHIIATLQARRGARLSGSIMLATEDRTGHTVFQNTIDQGHELHLVENSAKVLTIYAAQAPDILFLDAHLLQNKEASILRQLFQIDPGAYIIIISAPDKEEHLSKALSLGARGFVGKPFTAVEISEYVHTSPYIHRKQIRQNPCPKVA